jgi:glucosamine-6-phosphate deaminase
MEVVIVPTVDDIAAIAADIVVRALAGKPDAVLGLPTGGTPLLTYRELIRRHRAGVVSFARATVFLLDEYVGLPRDHAASYRSVIADSFADHVDLAPSAIHVLDGNAADLPAECVAFEETIADVGGVDLQLLGIGTDGHIAFNEPGSSLGSRTRLKTLTERTRADNARFFADASLVPRHVLTQGVATILEARHIVVLAAGDAKAVALAQVVEGPLTARIPGSALQTHRHVTALADEAAAAELELAPYYREIAAGKPAWQSY